MWKEESSGGGGQREVEQRRQGRKTEGQVDRASGVIRDGVLKWGVGGSQQPARGMGYGRMEGLAREFRFYSAGNQKPFFHVFEQEKRHDRNAASRICGLLKLEGNSQTRSSVLLKLQWRQNRWRRGCGMCVKIQTPGLCSQKSSSAEPAIQEHLGLTKGLMILAPLE